MTAPISTSEIEARWRSFTSTEEVTNATVLLEDAWAIAKATVSPSLDALLTADPTRLQATTAVLCAMVLRVLKNPDGLIQETTGNYSWQVPAASVASGLFMSPAEIRLMRQTYGLAGGVYTVQMSTAADVAWPYVESV